jgi:hypothetical protein
MAFPPTEAIQPLRHWTLAEVVRDRGHGPLGGPSIPVGVDQAGTFLLTLPLSVRITVALGGQVFLVGAGARTVSYHGAAGPVVPLPLFVDQPVRE